MPLRELNLIVDKDSGRLVQSFTSTLQAQPLKFVIGDAIPVSVRVVTADPNGVWQEVDLTDQSIRLAIGTPASSPTAGVWTITYGGYETSDLAYNASASAVETALNALSSIISAGGVTVTKSTNGAYRIIFDSAGARTDFSTDLAELYPSTESFVAEAVTGDGSTREVVLIKLETQPAAYVDLTTELPVAAATIATVRDGDTDVSEIQTLTLDPAPYAGTFTITIDGEESGAIEWDATNAEIKAAIEALASIGADKVTVTGALPSITVEFDASLTNVAAMTADVTGLTVPTGRKGEINTNTTGIVELLDGSSQTSATFEIEIFDTNESTAFTVVQTSCTVLDDVIGNTPTSQTPLPTYLSSGNSIVYDPDITGLTGGTASDLDSIATVGLDVGRLQAVVTTAEGLLIYELQASTVSEVSPIRIRPDDYAASTNEKVWVLRTPPVYLSETAGDLSIQFSGTQLVLTDPAGANPSCSMKTSGSLVFDDGSFSMSIDVPTPSADRTWDLPDRDGIFSFDPTIVTATPTTGFTITVDDSADQTHYLTPAGTLATGTFQLPTDENSRVGQIVRLHSTEEVALVTVQVAGSGTLNGATISTIAADTTYAFQCVSTAGDGTWIRLH